MNIRYGLPIEDTYEERQRLSLVYAYQHSVVSFHIHQRVMVLYSEEPGEHTSLQNTPSKRTQKPPAQK